MTDAEGGRTTYGYDGRGHVVFTRDPVGNQTRFTFDAGGRRVEERRYEGATLDLRIVWEFDSRDNRIRETAYDAGGPPLTQKRWEYDELGRNTRRVQMADPASMAAVNLAVDRVTDLTYVAGSDRLETETIYVGNPPQPRTTHYAYDAIGRLTLLTDPEGNTEVRTYTVHNQVATKTITEPPLGSRAYTYSYDDLGRMTSEVAVGPPALTTTYDYDALGRQIRMVDAKGIVRTYTYNAFDDLTWVREDATSPTPRQTEAQFNQLGYLTLLRTWDGQGLTETTTYQNDKLGRRTRIDFCDGGAWVYVYDAADRLIRRTDPRGQVISYTHTWRGQVLTKRLDGQLVESFNYTPLGWMTLAQRDASNRVTFLHDGFGQVTSETQTVAGVSKTVTHDYNQAGDRRLLGYPADVGVTLTFDHDRLGQTIAIRRNGQLLANYDYAGRFLTDRAVRTTNPTETWIRHHVGYDVHRRKTLITNSADVGRNVTELDRYVYTYDAVGNRQTATVAGDPEIADAITYVYDRFNRLRSAAYAGSATSELFHYDLLGNRLSYHDRAGATTTYAHNCVNEYTDITPGPFDPQYDDAGNLTRTETGYTLAYDYEQRLIEVRDPSGTILATYTYDALGRRATQVKDGTTTRFVYDGGAEGGAGDPSGGRVIAEYDAAGTLQRYYVGGPTYVDEHVLLHEVAGPAAGEFYYLHAALYSITGLTSAAGAPVVRYTYDAYGVPRVVGGSGPGVPPFGDADGDGDLDLADFAAFQVCYGGSGVPYGPGCDIFDANLDGDVDHRDLRVFLVLLDGRADFDHDLDIDADDWTPFAACLTGPGVPLSADANGDGWVDAADFQLWTACATAPGVLVGGSCTWADLDGDGDADLADFARLTLQVGLGLDPACRPGDLDGDLDVDLADAGLFQVVFTGPRGGGSEPIPTNSYLFTGRRLDFDLRDGNGRPLLVQYDYRARAYDPWHGRFLQRDPALYAESLHLYQYALSNPQGRLDPGGLFSFGDVMRTMSAAAEIYELMDTAMTLRQGVAAFVGGASVYNVVLSLGVELALDKFGGDLADPLIDLASPVLNKIGRTLSKGLKGAAELQWEMHHVFPKFLRGEGSGLQVPLPHELHKKYHAGLLGTLKEKGIYPEQ